MKKQITPFQLAAMIDISAVQAFHTRNDVVKLGKIALEHGFVAAHVLPNFLPVLREVLGSGKTLAGGPVGFPAGGGSTHIRVAEARELVGMGAQELDLMLNVGRVRSADFDYVLHDLLSVVDAVHPIPMKVILEVHYLSDDEVKTCCELCIQAGAAFVKTATGWAPGGATLERVRLMTDFVQGAIKVKASGGIRTLETVDQMYEMGVERFGINTAAAVSILEKCRERASADPVVL